TCSRPWLRLALGGWRRARCRDISGRCDRFNRTTLWLGNSAYAEASRRSAGVAAERGPRSISRGLGVSLPGVQTSGQERVTMQGQPQVIEYLKELLRGELAARDQYFLHSRMYADWGFTKLYERINHEMEEETEHADALLKRILF